MNWKYVVDYVFRRYKWFCIIGLVLIMLCVGGVYLYLHLSGVSPDLVYTPTEVTTEVVEPTEPVVEPVIQDVPTQSDVVQCYKFTLDSMSDIGSKVYLNGSVEGSETPVTMLLTADTQLMCMSESGSISWLSTLSLIQGTVLHVYTFDTLSAGIPRVEVLVLGDVDDYSLGVFKEAKQVVLPGETDPSTVWLTSSGMDMVSVTDAFLRGGPGGSLVSTAVELTEGTLFLYSRQSAFDVTDQGNVYYADDIIVFGLDG